MKFLLLHFFIYEYFFPSVSYYSKILNTFIENMYFTLLMDIFIYRNMEKELKTVTQELPMLQTCALLVPSLTVASFTIIARGVQDLEDVWMIIGNLSYLLHGEIFLLEKNYFAVWIFWPNKKCSPCIKINFVSMNIYKELYDKGFVIKSIFINF